MASIIGTQTEKNLLKAFASKSQARNRYTYWAVPARNEGFIQIASFFDEAAIHEKEHAKRFFSLLEGGTPEIIACYPAGVIGTTAQNLKAAINGEHEEWAENYPKYAAMARKEGFESIAVLFENIAIAEKQHESRFDAALKNVEAGTVFKKAHEVVWRCRNCGFTHKSYEALNTCPACAHPRAHFEVLIENW